MIIDAHAHWLPDEIISNAHFFHKGWGDIEAQLEMMRDAGIDKAVLSYPTSDAHLKLGSLSETARIYNSNVAAILKRYPGKFIGAAILPVDEPAGMADTLKRCVQDLGFKAVSLASSYNGMYLDDPVFLPVYEQARCWHVPVFVHAQIVNPIGFERVNDPLLTPVIEYIFDITICIGRLLMAGILREYHDLAFVFANFGGAVPFLRHRFDATYQMLRGINFVKDLQGNPSQFLSNIYVDTGGETMRANFLPALEMFGAQHLIWGSDWPARKDVSGSLKAVEGITPDKKDTADILGGNLQRIGAV